MTLKRTLAMATALMLVSAASMAETLRIRSKAKVRYGPSYETRVIGALNAGARVESLGRTGEWFKVALPDGEVGYVHDSRVEVLSSAPPAPAPEPLPPPAPSAPPAPRPPPPPPAAAQPRQAPAPARQVTAPPAPEPEPLPPPAPPAPPSPRPVAAPPAPPPAPIASPEMRFTVLLDGVYGLSLEFDETRTFEEFVEEGSLDNHYAFDAGFGAYGALQYEFVRGLGVRAAFSYVKRTGTADFQGRFPHPFFFGQHREASGEVGELSHTETSGHLDLVYTAHAGAIAFSLFAGGSIVNVEADLIGSIEKSEAFPYDTVNITGVTQTTATDSPFGYNVGAGLDFRISDSVGLGAQFFYSHAVARLEAAPDGSIEVDAGGGHVTAGLRIRF